MIGRYASSFGYDKDEAPQVPATLVLDIRQAVKNRDYKNDDDKKRYLLGLTIVQKHLLPLAEAHLDENPDGHVAFGCRLGKDRSVTLATELERRMGAKAAKRFHAKVKAAYAEAKENG